MASRRVVKIQASTLYRDLAGEGVLLQLDTGEYFGLDEVGNRMWQLLAELGDVETVRDRLLGEFDAEPAALTADLDRLLTELSDKQLVEISETAA